MAHVLIAIASASPAWAGPAVSFPTSFPPRTGCGPHNVEGWEFKTTDEITVSALGVYDSFNFDVDDTLDRGVGGFLPDGLEHSIPVGLYDSSCQLVASATIPAGTTARAIGVYRYVGITPVVLAADSTFRVAAVMQCDDRTPEFDSPEEFSIDPALTAVQTRRVGSAEALECPTETIDRVELAPNFLIGPACQNGVVQGDEQCDDGNDASGDCCSPTCQFESQGSPCPDDGNECSDDICDAAGTCTHAPRPSSVLCRPADGDCDVAENCDGVSTICPADGSEPDGTPCTDDGLFCTGEETCQSGSCTSGGDPCTVGLCDESADQCLLPSPTATPPPSNTAAMTVTRSGSATQTVSRTVSATQTAIRSATQTPTSTSAQGGSPTVTPAAPHTATPTPPTQAPSATPTDTPVTVVCVGDCDGGGSVAISELIIGVNIVLGTQPIDRCPAFDASGNRSVEINELVLAVNNVLNDCS